MTPFIPLVTLFAAALGVCALGLAFGGLTTPQPSHARQRSRALQPPPPQPGVP